jgi:hypothetical protein
MTLEKMFGSYISPGPETGNVILNLFQDHGLRFEDLLFEILNQVQNDRGGRVLLTVIENEYQSPHPLREEVRG